MKTRTRRLVGILISAVGILISLLIVDRLVGRWGFKTVLRQQSLAAAVVRPLDERSKAFLVEMKSGWRPRGEREPPTISEVLTVAGVVPSVQNLVRVLTSTPPRYSWVSPPRNRKALVVAGIRSMYMTLVPDHTVYVSEDEHLALMWLDTDTHAVMVFEDEAGTVRETWYSKKATGDGRASEATPVMAKGAVLGAAEDAFDGLVPSSVVSLIQTNQTAWIAVVQVTNTLSHPVDCSLAVRTQSTGGCKLSPGANRVVWSTIAPDEARQRPLAALTMFSPVMAYRYGFSGPVVGIPSGASGKVYALLDSRPDSGGVSLIVLQRPAHYDERTLKAFPLLVASPTETTDAEQAAPHEPPPRSSVSDAPDDRTLDSPPAPVPGGGR